ncbi:exosortase-associated EpsI family protein [bacterium]|nr:exosortase-associated EpsI family protein [bacterium]
MKTSGPGLAAAIAAMVLVAGVTVVQGTLTERWGRRHDVAGLERAARLLERVFPRNFGDWSYEKELESDPKELERAGAVGHVSRLYRSGKSKTPISAFVVCATPHDASGHTPDRCYPGAGFEIAETEHRETIKLQDGRVAEAFTGTFRKQGQTLRVFWTYGVSSPDPEAAKNPPPADAGTPHLRWIAPGIARIALNGEVAVYKFYAIIDQTKLTASQSMSECTDFLSHVLPALDGQIAADRGSTPSLEPKNPPRTPPDETGPDATKEQA